MSGHIKHEKMSARVKQMRAYLLAGLEPKAFAIDNNLGRTYTSRLAKLCGFQSMRVTPDERAHLLERRRSAA